MTKRENEGFVERIVLECDIKVKMTSKAKTGGQLRVNVQLSTVHVRVYITCVHNY